MHIYQIYIISKYILYVTSLNDPELVLLHIVKWFQVFLTQIILFTINHLFAHSYMIPSIAIYH